MLLIDPDAMGTVLRKVKGDKYKIINLRDAGSYYYKTDMEDVLMKPHGLAEAKPGTGIYILTDDEEILDEALKIITKPKIVNASIKTSNNLSIFLKLLFIIITYNLY